MDESHLLDEHTFEQPRLLQRNEKIIAVVSVSILCALVVCACYHGIHLSLLSLLLIALFLACVFINCILIGRVLMRIQERQLLSGQPEMFNEYVVSFCLSYLKPFIRSGELK